MDLSESAFDLAGAAICVVDPEGRVGIHDGAADNAQYTVCTVGDSLSRELMASRTAEFRDLARYLHDTISQDLVALSYNVSYLEAMPIDQPMDQPARTHTKAAVDLVDRCCRFIRTMSFMLAPPWPPETTLEECVQQYADYVREEAGLAVTVVTDPVPVTLPLEAQTLLFAAVQKWIAQGIGIRGKAAISVRIGNCGAGTVLEMETVSNASAPRCPDTGWALIRERTRALGGEFDMVGDSTRARISLPD